MLFAYKLNIYGMCGIMSNGSKNVIIYIRLLIYLLVGYFMYNLMNKIILFNHYNIFMKFIYILLVICIIDFIVCDLFMFKLHIKLKLISIIYVIFLLITLFYRTKVTQEIENPIYIFKWIKIIFRHNIVFYNVFGNVLIFIPFGYLAGRLKLKIWLIILLFSIPVFLEITQYLLYLGVFDIIDVILNMFGILVGYIIIKIKGIYYGRKETTRRKTTKAR